MPARAVVRTLNGRGYGVTPITRSMGSGSSAAPGAVAGRGLDEFPGGGSNLQWLGGPVMHKANTHVIYWDPSKEFSERTLEVIGNFFTGVAHDSGLASNVFGIAAQYGDGGGQAAYSVTFTGALSDTEKYPTIGTCSFPSKGDQGPPYTKCLTDKQLHEELSRYIGAEGLAKGSSELYFLLLPHKVDTCFKTNECASNVYCAYHSVVSPGAAGEIIYAVIPFTLLDSANAKACQFDGEEAIQQPNPDNGSGSDSETRFADVALKYISHEFIEATTDPLVGFSTAWVDGAPEELEIGDKCNSIPLGPEEEGEPGYDRHAFTPTLGGEAEEDDLFNQLIDGGHYYLQSEWDNAARACLMRPLALSGAAFSASPETPASGSAVAFQGSVVDPYHHPLFSWSFGDGTEGSGPSLTHTYARPGTYTVTMTPRDTFTNSTSAAAVTHTMTVLGSQTILFTSQAPAGAAVGGTYNVAASGGGSGNPVVLSIDSSSTSVCSISGALVTFTGVGTCRIDADQAASSEYLAAAQAQQSFAVTSAPVSKFASSASVNASTGAITFELVVADPGVFRWRSTFRNGRFGVFAASAGCRKGLIRLRGRCRPARVLFARGSRRVSGPGTVTVTLRPTRSGRRALAAALRKHRTLPVSVTISFQSSRGGAPASRTRTIILRPRAR